VGDAGNAIVIGLLVIAGIVAIIVGLVIWAIRVLTRSKDRRVADDPWSHEHWRTTPVVSGSDLLSQLLVVLAIGLTMVSLLLFAKPFGIPISSRTALLLAAACCIGVAYLWRGPVILAAGLVASFAWVGVWLGSWAPTFPAGVVAVLAGEALLAVLSLCLGRLHQESDRTARFGSVYWWLGLLGLVIVLFWSSSQAGLAALDGRGLAEVLHRWRPMALLGLLAVADVSLLVASVMRKRMRIFEGVGLGVITAAYVAFALVPPSPAASSVGDFFAGHASKLTAAGFVWAGLFNVLLLGTLSGIVWLGYEEHDDVLVNLSAVLLFAFVLIKYFDWFFTFLDKSLAFIVAGVLMLAVGLLMEIGRRNVLKAMEAGSGSV
jgi:hypothetical protein